MMTVTMNVTQRLASGADEAFEHGARWHAERARESCQ
jgi:hypothetical protein